MSEDEGEFVFELDRKSGVPKKSIKYTEEYAVSEIKRFADANPSILLTASN